MKRVKNSVRIIALAVMVCCLLTMGVFAAEDGSVWVAQTTTENSTAAVVITDATVTDGVVEVRYDAEALTYQGVTVNETYVAMHAVNADEAGVVLVSWVAPGEVAVEGNEWLIQVDFAGTADDEITLEGDLTGGEIGEAPEVDKTELEKTVLEAEGLTEGNYTPATWAALQEALTAYQAVLADPTATQEEIDAANAALRAAIEALELAEGVAGETDKAELAKTIDVAEGLKKSNYTEASWKALEKALKNAKAVFADADATQEEVDDATAALKAAIAGLKLPGVADTGDDSDLVMPIVAAVVCVVAIVAILFVMMKKKKEGEA